LRQRNGRILIALIGGRLPFESLASREWRRNQRLPAPSAVTHRSRPCRPTPANTSTIARGAAPGSSPKPAIAACSAPMAQCHVRRFSRAERQRRRVKERQLRVDRPFLEASPQIRALCPGPVWGLAPVCGKCDRRCDCGNPDCKPEHAANGAGFEVRKFDSRLRPALWAGAERVGLHLPALEANRCGHRLATYTGAQAVVRTILWRCQLQPWPYRLERLMAQPKTIPKPTYAKTLPKDDCRISHFCSRVGS
jgi:hypothetical protein